MRGLFLASASDCPLVSINTKVDLHCHRDDFEL